MGGGHTERKTRTSFSPVVTGTALAKDEVVRSEKRAKRSRAKRVHSTRLEIDQDGTGDILIRRDFVIVDTNSFKLKIVVPVIDTISADTVFIRHGLPELGTCSKGSRDGEYERRGRYRNRDCIPIWLPHW